MKAAPSTQQPQHEQQMVAKVQHAAGAAGGGGHTAARPHGRKTHPLFTDSEGQHGSDGQILSPALCRAAWVAVAAMSALEADAAVEDKSMDADAACRDEPDAMVVAVVVRNCCELQSGDIIT